jgi:uncharacterized membrane protein YfcA
MDLNLSSLLLVYIITLVGSIIQGSIGFGLGPLAVPLLVLIDARFIPGPLLLSALILTSLMALREHRSIHFSGLKWAIAGRLAGSAAGAVVLLLIPREGLGFLFGAMVLLAIGISISGIHLRLNGKNIFSTGVLSGIMSTTSAIGGAPMALIYQHEKGPRIRSTLSGIFVFGTIISILSLVVIGRFGLQELLLAMALVPGILSGFFLSRHTVPVLDRGFIRPLILIVAAVMGLIVILKNLI